MSKLIGYPELINLAAEMARGIGLPSPYSDDHPTRRTRSYWLQQLEQADERVKHWAMDVKAIADKISQAKP